MEKVITYCYHPAGMFWPHFKKGTFLVTYSILFIQLRLTQFSAIFIHSCTSISVDWSANWEYAAALSEGASSSGNCKLARHSLYTSLQRCHYGCPCSLHHLPWPIGKFPFPFTWKNFWPSTVFFWGVSSLERSLVWTGTLPAALHPCPRIRRKTSQSLSQDWKVQPWLRATVSGSLFFGFSSQRNAPWGRFKMGFVCTSAWTFNRL